MMETVKQNIRCLEVTLADWKSRRNEYRNANEKVPTYIRTQIKEEQGKIEGMFLALRLTLTKEDFNALCDWDYELVEQLEKEYNL